MVSIIKKQIFKYLSKFTKGLSTDKINLSTLKGEGELCNLELDEEILTDLLELPSWLKLTHAVCNRVAFRVPWTKLKSVPIHLSFDEVTIAVETCEELRITNFQENRSSYAGAAKYSFIHKVIDGVTVTVRTVKISFKSPAFISNVELSNIVVQSKSPNWMDCELRFTRLKDNAREQMLLFKELEWQNSRIEAISTVDNSLTPLKLLTEKGRCRIILKKRLTDSAILGSRLAIILEDLSWVLTDFQLKAALHFLDSLVGLIQKATEQTRKKTAARMLETLPEYQAQQYQSERTKSSSSSTSKAFAEYDVIETSYHFQAEKILLHFSDDPSANRSCHPELLSGGALQISLKLFRVDYYPYHLSIADRNHWLTYKNSTSPLQEWLREAHTSFTNSLLDIIEDDSMLSAAKFKSMQDNLNQQDENCFVFHESNRNVTLKTNILNQINKLMTSCLVLRISDFSLLQVTTNSMKKHVPKEFISAVRKQRGNPQGQGDKDRWHCLDQEPTIHAEFTYSYFPGDDPFPLPTPKFYVHLNPIRIQFDIISILWLNAFTLNLHQSLLQTSAGQDSTNSKLLYFDVKIEAIQPRIIFESAIEHPGQKDRPKSLLIQVSRATITNVRSNGISRADLEKCLNSFNMCSLYFNRDFPSKTNDLSIFNQKFQDHVKGLDNVRPIPPRFKVNNIEELYSQLKPDLLWTESRDILSIHLEPVFGNFYGTKAIGKDYPIPFLDAFPLTLWVYFKIPSSDTLDFTHEEEKNADIFILAHITTLVSVQLNHYQYLFLLRLSEEIKELTTYLGIDSSRIMKDSPEAMVIGSILPQIEVTLVMPSQSPGKESSGGDIESVYPDSSSLQDDVTIPGNCPSSSSFVTQLTGNLTSLQEKRIPGSELCLDIAENNVLDNTAYSTAYAKAANGSTRIPPLSRKALSTDTISFQSQQSVSLIQSSIKKKINKVMTLFDLGSKNSPEEVSDTISIKSDVSSGSDNTFVIFGDYSNSTIEGFCMDGMESLFRTNSSTQLHNQLIEIASEINEDTITSPTSERDSFTSYCRRRDLVSLMTFKFGKVEFLKQSEGLAGDIKVQISSVDLEECSSIPWDEFQNKFSSRSRDWVEVPVDAGIQPKVRLRLDHFIKPEYGDFQKISLMNRDSVLSWFEEIIEARLQSVSVNINASGLSGLKDFIEDEIIPLPFPLTVHLADIKLHITEDRPPINITSPGAVPMDIVISQLTVHRDLNGIIEIQTPKKKEKDISLNAMLDASSKTQLLILENEELRRRLSALEGLSSDYYRLKKQKQDAENNFLSRLEAAQSQIEDLLNNKKELLDKLTILNSELRSERNFKR